MEKWVFNSRRLVFLAMSARGGRESPKYLLAIL
jgi:hypothetical protein